MSKNLFHFNEPKANKPIVFEQIFAEKVGGGVVANSAFDLQEGLAVGKNADGLYAPIKCLKVVADATAEATTIKVAKGSGIVAGEFYAFGKKAVAATAIDTENEEYDEVTITLGVAVAKGALLFQAKAASTNAAAPVFVPEYILGQDIPAESGDALVKLVNGANIRKETALVADEVVALMKSIAKI